MTTTATLIRVETIAEGKSLTVRPVFGGVDRPITGGWGLNDTPSHRKLAARLTRCLQDALAKPGAVAVKADVSGATYADWSVPVIGRTMNADLIRLGY